MTREEFQRQLLNELNKHKSVIAEKIDRLIENIPEKAKTLDLQLFPSQDGDGMFSICASVDGPDLYVLNKAIKDYAYLFDPIHTQEGISPHIPTIGGIAVDFNVNDLVVDSVSHWLTSVWEKTYKAQLLIPVYIRANGENSKFISIKLN
jgi:hypothetical protein